PQGGDVEIERLQPIAGEAIRQQAGQTVVGVQADVKDVGGGPNSVAAEGAQLQRRVGGGQAKAVWTGAGAEQLQVEAADTDTFPGGFDPGGVEGQPHQAGIV